MTLYDRAKKDFIKTIDEIAGRYTPEQVFTDFVTMAAMIINTSVSVRRPEKPSLKELLLRLLGSQEKCHI